MIMTKSKAILFYHLYTVLSLFILNNLSGRKVWIRFSNMFEIDIILNASKYQAT